MQINPDAVDEARLPLLRAMLMNAPGGERLRTLLAARPPQGWRTDVFVAGSAASLMTTLSTSD
ncbi:hypothetical protein J4732_11670 [Serratia marcescens]|uniref:Uncharacterized protein n=1 Tax=Serratia marcescens TaxID=615 RepID=A0A939SNQ8_SERMA|nr:hypothetical protein [Serratia marcescens]